MYICIHVSGMCEFVLLFLSKCGLPVHFYCEDLSALMDQKINTLIACFDAYKDAQLKYSQLLKF